MQKWIVQTTKKEHEFYIIFLEIQNWKEIKL